ncbi:MAG: class I SAM-dependent RNA methyltransferase [Persicimonas sp.]
MTSCPGCPLLQTPYEDQLEQKYRRLHRALKAFPHLADAEVGEVRRSPAELGYRNRARMVVRAEANAPSEILGFYEEESRTTVPVRHCSAHHDSVERVLDVLRPLVFEDATLRGFARFVDVRTTAGHAAGPQAAIVTVAGDLSDAPGFTELEQRARDLHEKLASALEPLVVSTHLNIARTRNQAVLSGAQEVVAGQRCLEFEVSGERFRVSPGGFFQVNLDQLEKIHERMVELMAGDSEQPERLVDLYCGVGVHGIKLASAAEKVAKLFGTDASATAIELAAENAELAGVDAEFEALPDTEAAGWLEEKVDAEPHDMITNPARAGMSAETVALIGRMRPERILYLSCEPRTLARDADRLFEYGYRATTFEAYDFMPQTDQVETLAVLELADEPREPTRERAYFPEDPAERNFSPGVSGPLAPEHASLAQATQTVWIAAVNGHTPGHGFLPHASAPGEDTGQQKRIEIERIRKVESTSIVRIRTSVTDDVELRRRLRAWDHPALGDPDFGDRDANHLARRHAFLDRIALHCVAAEIDGQWHKADVPGQFMGLMRLPRKLLEELGG